MEKIYGVYTGSMDMSGIDNLHEIDIWKCIDSIGGSIFWTNHEAADGRITLSNEDIEKLNEMQYSLEYLVYYTRKFGVTFASEPKAGQHIERSEDYDTWYRYWNNCVSSWSDKQLEEFLNRKEKGQDYSDLLPQTNWKGEPFADVSLIDNN